MSNTGQVSMNGREVGGEFMYTAFSELQLWESPHVKFEISPWGHGGGKNAPAGNRTRGSPLATGNFTTKPLVQLNVICGT